MKTNLSMLKAYPIGSIYISTNNISPAFLFGGSWEELKDHATLMTDSSATLGNYSGNNTMSVEQMPRHVHSLACDWDGGGGASSVQGEPWALSMTNGGDGIGTWPYGTDAGSTGFGFTGGDQPFYPYHMSVKMWRRTA